MKKHKKLTLTAAGTNVHIYSYNHYRSLGLVPVPAKRRGCSTIDLSWNCIELERDERQLTLRCAGIPTIIIHFFII